MNSLQRVLSYTQHYWQRILVSCLSAAIFGLVSAAPTYLIQHTIDDIFIKQYHHLILPFLGGFLLIFILKGLFMYLTAYHLHWVSNKVVNDLRRDLFSAIVHFPPSFFQEQTSGKLLSYFLNDAQTIQRASQTLIKDGIRGIFEAAFLLGYAFFQNSRLAFIMLLIGPVLGVIIKIMGNARKRASTIIQQQIGSIASLLQEIFIGIRDIKALNAENAETKRISQHLDISFKSILRDAHLESLCPALIEIAAMSGAGLVLYCALQEVLANNLTAGQLAAFIGAVILAYQPLKKIIVVYAEAQYGLAAAERIFNLMDRVYPSLLVRTESMPHFTSEIVFDQVSFSYQDHVVIKDASFSIKKGERVGIIGPSGAGKSTVCDLLLGFLTPTKGQIRCDGKDITTLKLEALRNHIGYVGQHPFLFNDTIAHNVAYGVEYATQDDIVKACKMAYAHEFIEQCEHGYETIVGENGALLSGGQKQRITIARALLKKPSILIFDEATSSLDQVSESMIRQALSDIKRDTTVIIVSHRPLMLENVDRILSVCDQTIAELDRQAIVRVTQEHSLMRH